MSEEEKKVQDEENEKPENQDSGNNDELIKKKIICCLSYVFGILFFLPLIFYPDDHFAKFHANQGLVILIAAIVGEVVFWVLTIIPVLGVVFTIIASLFTLVLFIFCIIGILGVVKMQENELPLIGKIKILK